MFKPGARPDRKSESRLAPTPAPPRIEPGRGGGGKPGRETDHNRPELELGRTLPPADGPVKRDGGRIFAAVCH